MELSLGGADSEIGRNYASASKGVAAPSLTIASTVLDFVPGMEWLAVAGNIAATLLMATATSFCSISILSPWRFAKVAQSSDGRSPLRTHSGL